MEERTFIDAHGVEIATTWWPVDGPQGIVLISHGASEHAARYGRFAQALNAAGFAAVGLDHRGHGRMREATGTGIMGPGGGMAVVDDLHELRAAASAELGDGVPVFLFGHSMGAMVGLAYLTHHADGLAGGVLCGFAADIDGVEALGELLQGMNEGGMRDEPASDLLAQNVEGQPNRTPYDWLSRDPDEVDKYIADPFCGDDNPLTYGYLSDLFEVIAPSRDHLGAISCPVYVIAGDHDPAAAMGANATGLAQALEEAGVPVDLTLYEGARHELLNETNRDDVTTDLITWISSES
jgi:alpha-beta hydrolase superfamily lysophospholipase